MTRVPSGRNYAIVKFIWIAFSSTVIFSFLLGLSMVGTTSVAAGSSMSSSQIGGGEQELQEEEQQQRPQICGSSNSTVTDGNNASTTTGIASGNNNNTATSLYQNPEYGIQILCPEDWVYMEMANPPPFDFQVTFMSIMDAFEVGTTLESGATPEMIPSLAILTMEVPFGNADVRLLGDIITRGLASDGQQIISANPNTTLSGMPAFEVVTVEPENRTRGIQVWTVQGDRAYAVAYVSHESRFDQSLPIAQDMISSFTITNERSSTTTSLTGNNNNLNATTTALNTPTTSQQFQTSPELPTTTDGNNQTTSLEAARQQYLRVWNQTEFQIVFNTFIEAGSATGYGNYEERDTNNIFRQGETIQLYAEPAAFGHQEILDNAGNNLYLMNLTADIILSDTNGNELSSIEGAPLIDIVSYRQNTEMQLILSVRQDDPFPVGDYIITYIVYDQVKGESFQTDKEITITAADPSTSALSTSDATITTQFQTPSESTSTMTLPPSRPTITTTTTTTTTDDDEGISNQAIMNLEAARQQYLAVWNQTEFHISFSTYIEPGSATGYGVYEGHDNNNIFRQGETIQLYIEPAAFGHQQILDDNGNILYLMNFSADTILTHANNGSELATLDVPIGSIISHRQNTEEHIELTLTQHRPLPVGEYILTYIVHDEVSGESFQIDKRITIAGEEGAADNGSAGATTTIQEQQQQQPQEVEWLQHENGTYGVRMLYPSDWIQEAGTSIGERNIVVSSFFSPEEVDYAVVLVVIDNMPQTRNLQDYLNESIDSFMQEPTFEDFQVLSSSTNDFTLAGMPAYSFEASYIHSEFGPEHILEVGTIVDNKGYFIQYFADPSTYQQYFLLVQRMIESFEISQQLQQQQDEEQQSQQNQEDSFSAIPRLF
ncbi:MAG: hypothetical protein M3275_02855 [Thermoproteota archaeon]|nr:hypothetical protein [Thermoproteota archaeon]